MPARPPSLRLPAPAVALALLLTAGAAAQGPDDAAQAMATTPADAPAASPVGEPRTEPDPARPLATAADEARGPDSTVADESAAAEAGESDDDKEAPALAAPDASKRKLLEERLAGLDASGLADAEKQKAAEFYRRALASFDVATQQIEAARQFDAQLAEIQNGKDSKGKRSTAWYAARLAAPLPPYAETDGLSVEQVEKWAENCETNLAYYRGELAAMVAEPKRRSQRLAEAPKQIAAAEQMLKETSEKLAALGSEDAADLVAAAERQALELAEIECRATLLALQSEQRLYEKTGEWVTTRRDYYARYVPHKEKRLAQLREIINHLREQEAQSQARLATAAAEAVEATRPKQILELANDNKLLADERVAVAAAMNGVVKSFDATRATLSVLTDQYDRAERQAKELSNAGGQLLREQQAKLPNLHDLERSYGEREPLLSEVLIRSFELNDQSSELANLDERTDQLAAQAGDLSAASRAEVRMLLEAKRDTLKSLIDDYTEYSSKLNLLHTEEAKLIALTEEYADFIAERVLWIRSCKPPAAADLAHAVHAAAWSLDPHNWRDAGQGVMATIQRRPLQFAAWTLMLAALIGVQGPARRHLRQCGAEAKKRSCTRLRPTVQALGLTALVALPWPAALAFVGWSIDSQSELEFVRALGAGARFIAVCLLLLELARHLCRQNGIADAHFDWPHACLVHVRRKLRWLTTLGLPLTLWLVALEVQAEEPYWSSSLGRAQFIGVMLLLAAVWHRTLLAAHSPFRQISLIGRGGWLTPLEVIWRPAVVLLPVSLALLAVVGYYYTAGQAAVRILQTVGLLLAVLTLGGLTRRWLLVSRRRLAREQAKLRRVQLAAASDEDPASPLPSDIVDEAVDLAALSEQTQKLVRTFLSITLAVGLVLIWGEILPALKYPAKQLLPGAETLTWGMLGAFLVILAVTFVSVRDVPALLELVILQHLPLDSGARYAFTSLSRYVLTAIGLTAAFNSVGIFWKDVQWLVAAMSVGLGFGLQEIFGNFVSGIILLFERPIRVGDVVTLGDKTGVVNRIRMRATTIVDPDRKEYIVPNKDLVTERLLNWTLTDYTNRVEIMVNVASGTDTEMACALLLEASREQPHVLADPQPSAVFEGYAEGGLKLALRCFLPNLDNRGSTIHALHTAIDRKFRAAGIEGAYGDMRIRLTREGAHGATQQSHLTFAAKTDEGRQGAA